MLGVCALCLVLSSWQVSSSCTQTVVLFTWQSPEIWEMCVSALSSLVLLTSLVILYPGSAAVWGCSHSSHQRSVLGVCVCQCFIYIYISRLVILTNLVILHPDGAFVWGCWRGGLGSQSCHLAPRRCCFLGCFVAASTMMVTPATAMTLRLPPAPPTSQWAPPYGSHRRSGLAVFTSCMQTVLFEVVRM